MLLLLPLDDDSAADADDDVGVADADGMTELLREVAVDVGAE